MTGQPSGWGGQILFRGAGPHHPYWRRRWFIKWTTAQTDVGICVCVCVCVCIYLCEERREIRRTFDERPDILVIMDFAGDWQSCVVSCHSLHAVPHDGAEMVAVRHVAVGTVGIDQVTVAYTTVCMHHLYASQSLLALSTAHWHTN